MRKSLLTIAAASLVAGTTVAQATPVADVRDAAPVAQADALSGDDDGEGTTIVPIVLGLAGLIALLLLTGDDEEEEAPFSP